MDAPGELNRLRKIAYGRTSGTEEERAAADALRQLRELEKYPVAEPAEALAASDAALRQDQGTTPSPFAELGFGEELASHRVEAPHEEPSARRPLFWLAIAAVLLLCFGAGFATASALRKTPMLEPLAPDYTQSPDPSEGQPQLSDAEQAAAEQHVIAALAVLLGPQSEEDRAIMQETVAVLELNVATTQLLTEPGAYPRIFGAKNMADDICLIWEENGGGWGAACTSLADFGIHDGIKAGGGDTYYSWDGTVATISPSA